MRSALSAGLTFTVLMIALLFIGAILGLGIGVVEIYIWLAALIVGWLLILVGAKRSKDSARS